MEGKPVDLPPFTDEQLDYVEGIAKRDARSVDGSKVFGGPNEVVGHKTYSDDGISFRHEPITRAEADVIIAACEAEKAQRAADMPTEQDALNALGRAYSRLRELGWSEACYCPKDGSHFQVIEAGSTGIHDANYDGEWPNGCWWIFDGDVWPSRPILFKLYPEDQAKR